MLISSWFQKQKVDETFQDTQICNDGYSTPYHLDRNLNGGGILLFAREDMPSKMIKADLQDTFEDFL